MDYLEEYKQIHGHTPDYEELKEWVKQVKDQLQEIENDLDEQARDQIREIRVALGEEPETPPVVAKTCGHRLESGYLCGSLALRDRDYCAAHLRHRGRRLKMARDQARGQRWRPEFPPMEDLHAVQVGLSQVLQALALDQVDARSANSMLSALRQAANNIRSDDRFWEQPSRFQLPAGEGVAEHKGFEAEFGLPQNIDVNTPPEVAFPEPAVAEVGDVRTNLFEVTPTDIDLMETRQREGPEAVARKMKQLTEAEDRRYKRAQSQLAHARHVVRAAAQNAAREVHLIAQVEANAAAADAGGQTSRKEPQPVTAEAASDGKNQLA